MADKELIAALAQAAGLDRVWAEFPDDVVAGAEQAFGLAATLRPPDDPAAEPWPPMHVPTLTSMP